MSKQDARSLGREAQEALRKRAVEAHIAAGIKQCDVSKAFGVSPAIVCKWVKRFRAAGPGSLDARKKGPEKGTAPS